MNRIFIFLLAFLMGCQATNKVKSDLNKNNHDLFELTSDQQENKLDFSLKNLNKTPVILVIKNTLTIEMKVGASWKRLRILPCPCDAPCRERIEEHEIQSQESYLFSWDMKESWCGSREGNSLVRSTEYKLVDKGEYRIILEIKVDNQIEFITKEFIIN